MHSIIQVGGPDTIIAAAATTITIIIIKLEIQIKIQNMKSEIKSET